MHQLIRFANPEGNAHEAVYGPLQKTNDPFASPTATRFKTGRQGLGHLVLACRDKPVMSAFFLDTLGFRLSDHIRTEIVPGRPLEISFMRCNGRAPITVWIHARSSPNSGAGGWLAGRRT